MENVKCVVCEKKKTVDEVLHGELVRPPIADLIRRQYSSWSKSSYICLDDLNRFMSKYIEESLERNKGVLSIHEIDVVRSMTEQELLSRNTNSDFRDQLTFGQRMADKVAEFGGSWKFIICFAGVMFTWIIINTLVYFWTSFDPYPFILLNLALSCLAAVQAPIIMMSQNRQESKDRMRAEHDYRVNLKAELEVRQINEKIDHLITHQWQRFHMIEQQVRLIEELIPRKEEEKKE